MTVKDNNLGAALTALSPPRVTRKMDPFGLQKPPEFRILTNEGLRLLGRVLEKINQCVTVSVANLRD